MVHRYSFIIIFFALLAPLMWGSHPVETAAPTAFTTQPAINGEVPLEISTETTRRQAVIEVLDHCVAYEHHYRAVNGHFTKLISRLGYPMPSEVAETYDIRVSEASNEHLVMAAFSEKDGKTQDLLSIDQDYEIHANFEIPSPRPEYLKSLALRQLRQLQGLAQGQAAEEAGVFRGFFRFEQKPNLDGSAVRFAVGIQPPVLGQQVELGTGDPSDPEQNHQEITRVPASDSEPLEIEAIFPETESPAAARRSSK